MSALQLIFNEGKAEGEAKGKAEGRAEGEAKGKAETLLTFLRQRGFEVNGATKHRVQATPVCLLPSNSRMCFAELSRISNDEPTLWQQEERAHLRHGLSELICTSAAGSRSTP